MTYRHQHGLSLIELLIGVVISLFLILGMSTMFIANKDTFRAQQSLQRHQENARMSSILMTQVLRNAGSHIADVTAKEADVFSGVGGVLQAGAGDNGTTFPHSITVAYESDGRLFDCLGAAVGAFGAPAIVTNTFAVNQGNRQLTCSVNGGAAQPLVDGVENLAVRYGVDTDFNGSVDRYVWATEVSANNWWDAVLAVQFSVTTVSEDNLSPVAGTTTYFTRIGANAGAGVTSASDRRARREVTWVVAVNSRLHKAE